MNNPDKLITTIKTAFTEVEPPPSWCLTNSREGTEPAALEKEFAEVPNWDDLTAEFLDSTPDGFGSALSFFSDEAYRYYLPAYLITSFKEKLQRADPVFHLTHGFDNNSSGKLLNPRRYGSRTWFDYARYRHSVFNKRQANVIILYLEHQIVSNQTEIEKQRISEALENYWYNCSN